MLDYSDFTVVKNSDGMPTAMGIPIQSMLLKNNVPLFISGGAGKGKGNNKNKSKVKSSSKKNKKNSDVFDNAHYIEDGETYDDIHEHLAVPVGLACMTQTICKKTDEMDVDENDQMFNNNYDNVHIGVMNRATELNEADNTPVIPDDLYERLFRLAEETKPKKHSRRNKKQETNETNEKKGKSRKNKTHKKK